MRVLGLVSMGCFLGIGALVGARLLLLARRTRGAPELCAGLGLLLLSVGGQPFCAVGRLPGLIGTPLGDGLFAVGMALTAAGVALLYAFTWRVFRPGAASAGAVVVVAGLAVAAQCLGLLRATWGLDTMQEILPRTRPWAISITLSVAGAFGWTAVESLVYHRRLRRRLALGLADPVVVNRFLLWGLSGLMACLLCVQVAASAVAGAMVLHDPMALTFSAGAALAAGGGWFLTFFPPASYLRFVRRRAAARAAT